MILKKLCQLGVLVGFLSSFCFDTFPHKVQELSRTVFDCYTCLRGHFFLSQIILVKLLQQKPSMTVEKSVDMGVPGAGF